MPESDHDQLVRHSFERQVPLFSGSDSPFAHRGGGLAWIEPLDPGMVVLDVACGAGHAADPIAPQVRQVIGIDLTPALMTLGAVRLRTSGITNVLLQEGNAEAMPFIDESFDVVFCRSSLHHFGHPEVAVSEMARVCRRGGRVVLLDLVAPSDAMRTRFDDVHRLLDPSHMRTFLEPELAALMPGGIEGLSYANTMDARFPVEMVMTEQTQRDELLRLLQEEIDGAVEPTGLEPAVEDGKIVVSFRTCVVHAERA